MLLGLALRVWFIVVNDIDPRFSAADDGDYYQRALRLAATGEYVDNSWLIRPPGHIFLFTAALRLAIALGDPILGITMIRAFQVVLSLALVPIGYDLGRRLFSPGAGFIFAGIMAVWLPMVELPALILSEPLFFFMLVLHCWLLIRWRDSRHKPRSWGWLVAAGISLAIGALARSPALYGSVFTVGFLAITILFSSEDGARWRDWRSLIGPRLLRFAIVALAFVLPFVLTIAPWTIRNYVTYQRLIIIDTLGPVNLWMAMSDAVNEGRGEGEAKAILAAIPQAERQDFVSSDIDRIMREEPWRLTRNFWPHFIHIWKAQFVEDFFVKVSFFTRPLRDIWPVGVLADLIWFIVTPVSLFALVARPRADELAFRLLALGWIAYSCLTVMLIHVEPRYLLPIWMFMSLYGAAALANGIAWLAQRRRNHREAQAALRTYVGSPWGIAGIVLALGMVGLIISYRDYPRIIADGVRREIHRAAGARAYAAGDNAAAEREFQAMLTYHPTFVDGRVDLARVYLDQGMYNEAWEALGTRATHRSDVIRGALSRAQGDLERAQFYFEDAEFRAGEDVQLLSMEWLPRDPVTTLDIGNGLDFGYLDGFSFGEDLPPQIDGDVVSFRWLQSRGVIELPLPEPLQAGSVITLRMTGGLPGETPLDLTIDGVPTQVMVRGGEWRNYRIAVPDSLIGRNRLEIRLQAPTFIPVQVNPASSDARLLSLMISKVSVD
ncbi:MAG: tetratricopeptide repeat protein [Oscillochloris sp.]|nr:tetratricopeptide repeat protein [Oscillochloris sp.]